MNNFNKTIKTTIHKTDNKNIYLSEYIKEGKMQNNLLYITKRNKYIKKNFYFAKHAHNKYTCYMYFFLKLQFANMRMDPTNDKQAVNKNRLNTLIVLSKI